MFLIRKCLRKFLVLFIIGIIMSISIVYQYSSNKENLVLVAVMDTELLSDNGQVIRHLWLNPKENKDYVDNNDNNLIDDIHGYNFPLDKGEVISDEAVLHGYACTQILIDKSKYIKNNSPKAKIVILPVIVSRKDGFHRSVEDIVKAIDSAEKNNVKICNMSFSIKEYNSELYEKMKNSKMLFVISSGNGEFQGKNIDKFPSFPASFNLENMIVVANLKNDNLNSLAFDSNYGKNSVDVAACGTNVPIRYKDKIRLVNGTSFAAPIVTALATDIAVSNRNLTAVEIKHILCLNCMKSEELEAYVNGGKYIRTRVQNDYY